jgi:hypothetical protein
MAIKGQQINVTLDPRAYKELNPLENRIPTHMDLRNGHYTDAKYWERRPGFLEVVTIAPIEEIERPPPIGDFDDDDETGGESNDCGFICPLGQYAELIYDGGTEPVGVVIRRTAASSVTAFYGLVALYVPAQLAVALVLYDGEPLSGLGTVITAVDQTLAIDDVFRLEADTEDFELYKTKVNGSIIIQETIIDDDLSIANPCVGVVRVVDVPDGIVPEEPPPGEEEEAMIANQAADLDITSQTTPQDTDLTLAMEANSTYVGHVNLRYSSASATPDMNFTLSGPALCEGQWFDCSFGFEAYALDEVVGYSVSAAFDTAAIFTFTVRNQANVGDLKFKVSQRTSNGTALTVKQDSSIIMFKKV